MTEICSPVVAPAAARAVNRGALTVSAIVVSFALADAGTATRSSRRRDGPIGQIVVALTSDPSLMLEIG